MTVRVYDELIGQEPAVRLLRAAAEHGDGMTHAWLFTGPPGCGRSVAARAFAAALLCLEGGCGECHSCRLVAAGTHPDLDAISPTGLSIGVDLARTIVARAARAPSRGRWQVVLIEDADRLTEQAANALLKAIEEPSPRAVFCLCAPSAEELLPTVRSRCRVVGLRQPPAEDIARVLEERDGIPAAMAAFAARASGGHVGRARRLATDEASRLRRREVLDVPLAVRGVAEALTAADNLVGAARDEAATLSSELDGREKTDLEHALGVTGRQRPRGTAGLFKDLEDRQKSRTTRTQRDALDRALSDLASFYRDVLVVQAGAGGAVVPLDNVDVGDAIGRIARDTTPESTLRRLEAVLSCREAIEANVAPLLAVEAMTLSLLAG